MSFWKNLFGKKCFAVADMALTLESLSESARENISDAITIIESQIKMELGTVIIESAGSEGKVMEAVRKFKIALDQHPDNPLLHYAYASSLHLAMQYQTAENEMKKCLETHPDFIYAKLALEGWGKWLSMFTLPPWGTQTKTIHPALSQIIKTNILLPIRDGLIPRAAVFVRAEKGVFKNIQALRSTKITIASSISHFIYPKIIGVYAKVYYHFLNPLILETLGSPCGLRGDRMRSAYEYMCIQKDIDFAIIDHDDRILINKRLLIPSKMDATNQEIFRMIMNTDGIDISTSQLIEATIKYQQQFSLSDVKF